LWTDKEDLLSQICIALLTLPGELYDPGGETALAHYAYARSLYLANKDREDLVFHGLLYDYSKLYGIFQEETLEELRAIYSVTALRGLDEASILAFDRDPRKESFVLQATTMFNRGSSSVATNFLKSFYRQRSPIVGELNGTD